MDARAVIISGGVACNAGLRAAAAKLHGVPVYFPSFALSTDNAVMIGAAAFPKLERGEFLPLTTTATANLPLAL
jgi:N6-L-threonylcarbamoyladenine synthase